MVTLLSSCSLDCCVVLCSAVQCSAACQRRWQHCAGYAPCHGPPASRRQCCAVQCWLLETLATLVSQHSPDCLAGVPSAECRVLAVVTRQASVSRQAFPPSSPGARLANGTGQIPVYGPATPTTDNRHADLACGVWRVTSGRMPNAHALSANVLF